MGTQDFTVLKGDSFGAHRFTFTLSGGSAFTFTGATPKIMLKRTPNDQPRLTWTVGDGLTILNQTSTILDFEIDEQIIDLLAFEYVYDIQINMTGNVVKTWLGGTFTVIDTVTT